MVLYLLRAIDEYDLTGDAVELNWHRHRLAQRAWEAVDQEHERCRCCHLIASQTAVNGVFEEREDNRVRDEEALHHRGADGVGVHPATCDARPQQLAHRHAHERS